MSSVLHSPYIVRYYGFQEATSPRTLRDILSPIGPLPLVYSCSHSLFAASGSHFLDYLIVDITDFHTSV